VGVSSCRAFWTSSCVQKQDRDSSTCPEEVVWGEDQRGQTKVECLGSGTGRDWGWVRARDLWEGLGKMVGVRSAKQKGLFVEGVGLRDSLGRLVIMEERGTRR